MTERQSLRSPRLGLLTAGLSLPLALSTVAVLPAGVAHAQPRPTPAPVVIAMMPFDGKDTPAPPKKPVQPMMTAAAIADTLSARPQASGYRIIAADLWASLARLRTRNKASELQSAAKLLKAGVLIGGYLEATPGSDAPKPYRLTLTLYDAQGQLLGQLAYDLDQPTIVPAQFSSQATAFFQMLDQAVQPLAPMATSQRPAQPGAAYSQSSGAYGQAAGAAYGQANPVDSGAASGPAMKYEDKEEAPLLPGEERPKKGPLVPQSKEAHDLYDRRGPWTPGLDLRLGFLWNGRSLSNEGSDLRFPFSGAPGIALHAELYPLAFVKHASDALAGFGARIDVQRPFWNDIQQKTQLNGGTSGLYSASEYRVEGGIRWHYNPWNAELRPDFEVEGLYGVHSFSTKGKENIDYLRIPPAEYRYAGAQFGMKMFFTRRIAARAALTLAKLLSLGLLDTPGVDGQGNSTRDLNGYQSYGPGSGMLWRLDLGASADVFRGITLGAAFYYEQNRATFEGQGNVYQTDGKTPVSAMQDSYTGVMLTLGYVYRPWIR
jgi:hypothetical protein